MECMEARALKSSYSSELGMKTNNPQAAAAAAAFLDDIWCLTTAVPGEDFSIDEFFNLPNDENINNNNPNNNNSNKDGSFFEEEEEEDEEEKDSNSQHSNSSHGGIHDSLLSSHLAIPDDDMQELELWSHLMDDSVPEPNLACSKAIMEAHSRKTGFTIVNRIEPSDNNQRFVRASFFPTAVPVKPRSKRSRANLNRAWFSGSPPKTESSSSSSLSPSSPVSTLLFAPPAHEMGMWFTYGKPPVKKPKKKQAPVVNGETGFNSPVQRRCSHCQVTKTPQWRAGPNGPKTLCNACGVRYKSGRLFPEYRPACSPTFSSEVHSNSHRKVLEMRRKKEEGEPETGPAHPLSLSSS